MPRHLLRVGTVQAVTPEAVLRFNHERKDPMARQPIIVFDVNETLLDLESVGPTFAPTFDDPAARRLWFANLITYSEALILAGVNAQFFDIVAPYCGCLPPLAASQRVRPTTPRSPTGSRRCRRIPRFPRPCVGRGTRLPPVHAGR